MEARQTKRPRVATTPPHANVKPCPPRHGAVFVTGANGYIGAGVACAFRSKGYKVFGLVREKKQAHDLVKHEIIPVLGDLNNPSSYENFVRKSSVVVNNAVDWDDPNWNTIWSQLYDTAVRTTKESGPKMFIETSAPGILIYGDQPGSVLHENSHTCPEHDSWRDLESKLINSEELIGVVVRAGFAYGKAGGLTHNLFNVGKEDKLIIQPGTEDVRWSWVHIDDLSDAYVKIAEAWTSVGGEVFNIAGDDTPTWKELRLRTAKASGFKGTIGIGSDSADGLWNEFLRFSVVVSAAKARERVGWVPHHKGFLSEIETYYYTWREHWADASS